MVDRTDILKGRILVVDDQEANVLLLEQMLRAEGYESVTSTMDPTQVCELHLKHHYDLILLDILMPRMDGFQVMENLKTIETGGYLPVLVITAQSDHKLRALKAGAKDFVSKPFDLAEVLLRVYNMIEVRLLHLEALRLYGRILEEQKVSERLLLELMPKAVADRLTPAGTSPGLVAEHCAEVTVLFKDLVAFTRFSRGASAQVLKGVLEDLATRFQSLDPEGEKRRTLDHAYLASAGLPDTLANHTMAVSTQAVDLAAALDRFNGHNPYQLKVRLAITPADEAPVPLNRRKAGYPL